MFRGDKCLRHFEHTAFHTAAVKCGENLKHGEWARKVLTGDTPLSRQRTRSLPVLAALRLIRAVEPPAAIFSLNSFNLNRFAADRGHERAD